MPWQIIVVTWAIGSFGMGILYGSLGVLVLQLSPPEEQGVNSAALQISDSLGVILATGLGGVIFATAHVRAGQDGGVYLTIFLVMTAIAVVGHRRRAACRPSPCRCLRRLTRPVTRRADPGSPRPTARCLGSGPRDHSRPGRRSATPSMAARCSGAVDERATHGTSSQWPRPGPARRRSRSQIAADLLAARQVRAITVVAPTEHLKQQWADAAARLGVRLDPRFTNAQGATGEGFDGVVVTYAQVAAHPMLHRARTREPQDARGARRDPPRGRRDVLGQRNP